MKKTRLTLLSLALLGSVALSGCYVDLGFIQFGTKPNESATSCYDEEADVARKQEYYSSLDTSLSGTQLLNALRNLNLSKREKEVGYNDMSTSSSGLFKYTDYDPASAKINDKGIPYGTKISSFYSGKVTMTFNREHVWPKSRGGNLVENDILMVRPTITEENSDRGNSTYITGMVDQSKGWDPVTAFANSLGVYNGIRGECARIIFYCMTASSSLVLNDNSSNQGNNMGSITNLVEWACENPVNDRELRRNVGAQYLQGNRNSFVDHPEYACKIWGSTNQKTKTACQNANYAIN